MAVLEAAAQRGGHVALGPVAHPAGTALQPPRGFRRIADGDIVAVSQKVVSKSEGRVVRLDETDPGPEAVALAARTGKDPRLVQHVLNESRNLIRVDEERGILITETHHGFICANAGIDQSNTANADEAILLPLDPDGSARRIRVELETAAGIKTAVVVTDTRTEDQVKEYTGETKEIGQVTVATYQILTYRPDKTEDFPHFGLFEQRDWGLIVYDEVHLLPAPVFRVTATIQARRRLGLTATLIREDGREGDVFSLIGPKKYDVPWRELEGKGWIASAS